MMLDMNTGKRSCALADLLRRRIASAYGGNQAAFARATQLTPQTVNAIVHGKVALPETIEYRRRLARELGVRHVDLFVLAGELGAEEIDPQPDGPFAPDDPRAVVVDLLRRVSNEDLPAVALVAERLARRDRR